MSNKALNKHWSHEITADKHRETVQNTLHKYYYISTLKAATKTTFLNSVFIVVVNCFNLFNNFQSQCKTCKWQSKYKSCYYNLLLLGYMFRLLRIIIRPSSEPTYEYLLQSAIWDPVALTIGGVIVE